MKYFIDTNVFIDYWRFYPIAQFSSFWGFIETKIVSGEIVVCSSVYDELLDPNQKGWLDDVSNRNAISFYAFENAIDIYGTVINGINDQGYYNTKAMSTFQTVADAKVIACAKKENAYVVTNERPGGGVGRVKVPDACNKFGVPWINGIQLFQLLGFSS